MAQNMTNAKKTIAALVDLRNRLPGYMGETLIQMDRKNKTVCLSIATDRIMVRCGFSVFDPNAPIYDISINYYLLGDSSVRIGTYDADGAEKQIKSMYTPIVLGVTVPFCERLALDETTLKLIADANR